MDIRKFFDTLKHEHLREFIRRRVRDGVLTRLIGKWLKAGVMEGGQVKTNDEGTPQGGVISPLLANIYLHEVLDRWYVETVRSHLKGQSFLIRYADDFVMGFELQEDAERVEAVLSKRFEKYGLKIHAEKTRLVDFRRPRDYGFMKDHESETFDFLGFTHYWAKNQKGHYSLKHKTMKGRLKRSLVAINLWCRGHRHKPLKEQWHSLVIKLRGHYGYYGITSNTRQLHKFWHGVRKYWFKWLNRRQQKRNIWNWGAYEILLKQFVLPTPKISFKLYESRANM